MLYRRLPLAFALVALAIGALVTPSPAQPPGDGASLSAATKKPAAERHAIKKHRASHQVACTVFGCQPIPRNCHPQQGYDWDGIPTGFDIIVCR